jgi:hypothetical protein
MASFLQLLIFMVVLAAWLGALWHFGRDKSDKDCKAKESDSSGSEQNSDIDDTGAGQNSDSDNGGVDGPRMRRGR